MEIEDPPPGPSPYRNPSAVFKDISNFKTPKRHSKISNFNSPVPQFFTASKQTPITSSSFRRRPSLAPSKSGRTKTSATARKLKAFELDQSQSSRKAQIQKEESLKSLAKSLTVWLNFLFQNPRSCGCNFSIDGDRIETPLPKGKRDSEPGSAVRVDSAWRDPKRQRDSAWKAVSAVAFSSSKYSNLRSSLDSICSVDDLTQRMRLYLSMGSCKEVFDAITQVAKNIDEGRLKMKAHCPLVSDVGLKEKAIRILMSYNPIWLRIGLYIVFGGDSLLSDRDVSSDEEIRFLKVIIEKQFLAHAGMAKDYAYNKKVEGLYRPGYYEALGNVILKRFLLLVLILDRAKCQSSLSLKYGIDGVDGGSPLLFRVESSTKSSHHVIHDFLSSDVMLGEGNVFAHLVTLGYKVSHQQHPLVEFDFRVTDLFVDLQDGVRLCRAIQLLQDDTSILLKMVVPVDTLKKHLANCGIALQYLRQAGVVLNDEDGMTILADDIVGGDKELTLSLLWNMFVHLQLPRLVKKTDLAEEISRVRGNVDDVMNFDPSSLDLLLNWIQAICESYACKVDSFSSLVDGKAIWCLLDYYFRKQLCCGWSEKDPNKSNHEESIMLVTDYSDAVHNFLLSQKLLTLLGNFPEVLQISDILEYNGARNDRSVVILLVFLSSQLIVKKNMDQLNFHKLLGCDCQSLQRKYSCVRCSGRPEAAQMQEEPYDHSAEDSVRNFKAIQAWWQDMAERNHKPVAKPAAPTLHNLTTNKDIFYITRVTAAKRIQSHFRRATQRGKYLKMLTASAFLQTVFHAWLSAKQKSACTKFSTIQVQEFPCERWRQSEAWRRYAVFFADRHSYVKLRKSVLLIQRAARKWITRRHQVGSIATCVGTLNLVNAAIVIQRNTRRWFGRLRYIRRVGLINKSLKGAVKIQVAWKSFSVRQSQHAAATKIQSHFRSLLLRKKFHIQRQAAITIQSFFRMSRCWKAYQQYKIASVSATIIQSHARGCFARRGADQRRHLIVVIQRYCRGWLIRSDFLCQREAAVKIQSAIHAFLQRREAAVEIQRIVRGRISRKRLLGASSLRSVIPSGSLLKSPGSYYKSAELNIVFSSVLKLQRWCRSVVPLKLRSNSAVIIQSHIRGWIDRQKAARKKQSIVLIQSLWRGYLARKEAGSKLLDLRLRVQKSATNVDDSMRIINRLIAALSELQTMKSVSGILHTCVTLDRATQHSQKCCEKLVEAGAIKSLLRLFRSATRSIPDQEVLKHVISTLRNLARYPHLVEVLIDSSASVETILSDLLRNKEEGYFIGAELLKKICSSHKGVEAIRKSPAYLKRLHSLVEELRKKAANEKRNARVTVAREHTERRLREAVEILTMATKSWSENLV